MNTSSKMNFNFGIEFPENDGDEINALFMSETEIDSYIIWTESQEH